MPASPHPQLSQRFPARRRLRLQASPSAPPTRDRARRSPSRTRGYREHRGDEVRFRGRRESWRLHVTFFRCSPISAIPFCPSSSTLITDIRTSFSSSFFPSSVAIRISREMPGCGAMSTFGWAGSTGCARFSCAGGKREKSRKSRSPSQPLSIGYGLLPWPLPSAQGPTVPPDGEQYGFGCRPPPRVCILSPPFRLFSFPPPALG